MILFFPSLSNSFSKLYIFSSIFWIANDKKYKMTSVFMHFTEQSYVLFLQPKEWGVKEIEKTHTQRMCDACKMNEQQHLMAFEKIYRNWFKTKNNNTQWRSININKNSTCGSSLMQMNDNKSIFVKFETFS